MKILIATGKVDREHIEELAAMSREVLAEMKKAPNFAHAFFGIQEESGDFVAGALLSGLDAKNPPLDVLPAALMSRLEVFATDWGPVREIPLDEESGAVVYEIVESTFH